MIPLTFHVQFINKISSSVVHCTWLPYLLCSLQANTEKALPEHEIVTGHTTSSILLPPNDLPNNPVVKSSEVSYTSQSTQTDDSSVTSASKSLLATGMPYDILM